MNGNLRMMPGVAKVAPTPLPTVQALESTRGRLGLSQDRLAARVKVHRDTVRNWLRGKHPVSIESLSNDNEVCRVYAEELARVMGEREAA